jgi:transcriptional regulator with XRE-family HTH domain
VTSRARESVSEKIDHLFHAVRRGDGREYTYDDVEQGTNGRVSRSYVWKLRHGRNRNPSLDVLEAMAEFFKVPPEYFFSSGPEDEERAKALAEMASLLQDEAVRLVAEKARGLSSTSLEAVGSLVDNLHAIERSGRRVASPTSPGKRETADANTR